MLATVISSPTGGLVPRKTAPPRSPGVRKGRPRARSKKRNHTATTTAPIRPATTPSRSTDRLAAAGHRGPSLASVVRLLLIVSRTDPGHYTYLKRVLGGAAVDVIVDRRVAERRQRLEQAADDRRQESRRQRDISMDLQASGWALVRTA